MFAPARQNTMCNIALGAQSGPYYTALPPVLNYYRLCTLLHDSILHTSDKPVCNIHLVCYIRPEHHVKNGRYVGASDIF